MEDGPMEINQLSRMWGAPVHGLCLGRDWNKPATKLEKCEQTIGLKELQGFSKDVIMTLR